MSLIYRLTGLLWLVAAQTLPSGPAAIVRSGFALEELKEALPIPLPAPSAAWICKTDVQLSDFLKAKRCKVYADALRIINLHGVDALQGRPQSISDPFVNLNSQKFGLFSYRLFSGLKLFG